MAKRKREFTNAVYEKRIKEGRGSGIKSSYKPWITIQDVPSSGKETRIHGIKTDRQHDLLSDNETNYFYLLEFSNVVVDIREQFPLLPIEQTITIADEIGVKHSTDPKTKELNVMTTDFLITDNKGRMFARTVKLLKDLYNKRQMEKFEIEKRYWRMKGIDWGIVTERNINETISRNVSIIHPYYNLNEIDTLTKLSLVEKDRLITAFKNSILGDNVIIRHVTSNFDKIHMLSPGTGIDIFKHLLIVKEIQINMMNRLSIDNPQEVLLTDNMRLERANTQ